MNNSPLHRDRVQKCRDRWIELADRYGYSRGWRQLHREFDPALCADVATQGQTTIVGSAHGDHKPNAETVAAASRYAPLLARAGA